MVDTDGRGLVLEPHPANVQDRDGGGPLVTTNARDWTEAGPRRIHGLAVPNPRIGV